MISPIQNGKTYGVLYSESFFSFLGFSKKIGSDETQKIDIFLDDKLIDTIEANEFILKIDDMHDNQNSSFRYNLPSQYIEKKSIISFKNHHSGDELLNSPYTLIDKNHKKFNEAKFIHSLNEPLNEDLKSLHKPNNIGFLANKENLEDKDFVEYINEIVIRFPNVELIGFYFDKNMKSSSLINKKIKFLKISSIIDIIKKIEIFIWDIKDKIDLLIVKYLLKYNDSIFNIFNFKNPHFIDLENKSLKEYDKFYLDKNVTILTNPKKFGFSDNEIKKSNRSYTKLIYEAVLNRDSKNNFDIDLEQNALEFLLFKQIELALNNKQFKKDFIKNYNLKDFKWF